MSNQNIHIKNVTAADSSRHNLFAQSTLSTAIKAYECVEHTMDMHRMNGQIVNCAITINR